MSYGKFINQYKKSAVTSASPLQLIIMLYDAAIRNMAAGKEAILKKDLFLQNKHLKKTQDIMVELIANLDMEKGGEIAEKLSALYTFVYESLVTANIEDNPASVERCIGIMSALRESWIDLEKQQKSQSEDRPEKGLEDGKVLA